MPRKHLDIQEFLPLYRELIAIESYTARKRLLRTELLSFLGKHEGRPCRFSWHSPSCKVHRTQHFTIFKVRDNQRGILRRFRGRWILMYNFRRMALSEIVYVCILKSGGDYPEMLEELAMEFPKTFKVVSIRTAQN